MVFGIRLSGNCAIQTMDGAMNAEHFKEYVVLCPSLSPNDTIKFMWSKMKACLVENPSQRNFISDALLLVKDTERLVFSLWLRYHYLANLL